MDSKGIIFDLDGTLWDSSARVAVAWSSVLEQRAHRWITVEDMRNLMGKTMTDIFRILLPSESEQTRARIAGECCREEQDSLRKHGGTLYPLVPETLEKLGREYRLFIVSNCQTGYIESFLDYYRWKGRFADTECFGRTGKCKGENIKALVQRNRLERAVYVGDTILDREAAAQAGVPFIHAAYGYGKVDGASYSVRAFSELPQIISAVFS